MQRSVLLCNISYISYTMSVAVYLAVLIFCYRLIVGLNQVMCAHMLYIHTMSMYHVENACASNMFCVHCQVLVHQTAGSWSQVAARRIGTDNLNYDELSTSLYGRSQLPIVCVVCLHFVYLL